MTFSEIPKFVINLKRRPDRLQSIIKEMEYIGWEFELFEAIDKGSYMGCTLSHLEIFKICQNKGYEKVIIIEDDTYFMPYTHHLLEEIEKNLENIDYLNFGPTINRSVNFSEDYDFLLDLKNLPDLKNENERGIYTTNCVLYDRKLFTEIEKISETKFQSGDFYYAIDDFIYQFIMPNFNSFCPILPISTQGEYFSDVSNGFYNNFYTLTYNWNSYTPFKIPPEYLSHSSVQEIKKNNLRHKVCFSK